MIESLNRLALERLTDLVMKIGIDQSQIDSTKMTIDKWFIIMSIAGMIGRIIMNMIVNIVRSVIIHLVTIEMNNANITGINMTIGATMTMVA